MYPGRSIEQTVYLGRCIEQVNTILPECNAYATVLDKKWTE